MRLTPFLFLAVKILSAQPEVTSWDILAHGLDDKNYERRRQAVTAIGSIGLIPDAVKMVEHGLRDDDPLVRQTAAAQLGQMKSMQSIPALKAALNDPSAEVAVTAARILWELGDHSGEETLQQVLSGKQKSTGGFVEGAVRDTRHKLSDRKGLVKMGIKEASSALLGPFSLGITAAEEMMKDSGATGRALAADILSRKCDSRNIELLQSALREEKNNTVKAAVAKSLARCGNKDDIPRYEMYLSSSNDALRFMTAAAIIKLTLLP